MFLMNILFPAIRRSFRWWARSLGESTHHGALVLLFLLHSQPSRDPLEGGLAGLASPCATACWLLFLSFPAFQRSSGRWAHLLGEPACHGALALLFYFVPSLPEILWKVGSLAWRVCAPWCVGLYLLRPQPSRDPLEGGLVHLVSLHAMACWSLIYLLHPQPSRDPLEGGLVCLASHVLQHFGLLLIISFQAIHIYKGVGVVCRYYWVDVLLRPCLTVASFSGCWNKCQEIAVKGRTVSYHSL